MKKIALIGTGGRGSWFLSCLAKRNDCTLVAACDKYPTRLEMALKLAGAPDVLRFTDAAACVERSGCDAVFVCTPDGTHAEVALPALRRGLFVYLEKPLDITREACRALVEADRATGGRTYVGHNLRWAPLYRRIKEIVAAGTLGRILTIQADEFYGGGKTYFRRWNRFRSVGGGLWITKCCHDFDILHWLADRPPRSVAAFDSLTHYRPDPSKGTYCGECRLKGSCPDVFGNGGAGPELVTSAVKDGMERPDLCLWNSEKDTFDHGIAVVNFDDGIVATLTVNVVAADSISDRRIRVAGALAALDGTLNSQTITIHRKGADGPETVAGADTNDGHGGADANLIPDFFAFMDGKSRPAATPAEAMVAVEMGLAATESSDTGRTVPLGG